MHNDRSISRTLSGTGFCFIAILFPAETTSAATAKETILYSFQGSPDGKQPYATLIKDKQGNLFGTTNLGGTGNCNDGRGTVFELTPGRNGKWN